MPSLNETVFSQRGAILTSDAGAKRIVLEDGMILSNDVDRASLLRFERMETELPELEADKDVPVDLLSTLPFAQLIRAAQADMGTQAGRLHRIEAHRRVALGAATLPFGLLAMGLAFQRRRLSRSGGTVMGIIGAIAYYALVQLSEGMLRSENAPIRRTNGTMQTARIPYRINSKIAMILANRTTPNFFSSNFRLIARLLLAKIAEPALFACKPLPR